LLENLVGASVRHFGTSADMSGQFGTGSEMSYGHFGTNAEMSWVRSVLGPKCLDTNSGLPSYHRPLQTTADHHKLPQTNVFSY